MPSKVQIYAQLAEDTGRQIMKDYENWTAFLRTSARLYKYPYADQLMIYAQRPDATACASYDLWNNTMHRYVKRDSKGIALLRANGDNAYLTYVFDVSDTGTRRNSRPVVLMEMYPEHTEPVMSALEDRYGVSGDKSFEDQILDVSRLLAEEYWEVHNGEIFDIVEGSVLEGYDVVSIKNSFLQAVSVSTAYAIYSRLTGDPDGYFDQEDFRDVFDFRTSGTTFALGTAVSMLSASSGTSRTTAQGRSSCSTISPRSTRKSW